jgi:hypothetical protein
MIDFVFRCRRWNKYIYLNIKLGLVGFGIPVGFKPGNPTIQLGNPNPTIRKPEPEPDDTLNY